MYKVLIVDDEVLARAGITALIPWEKHGFTIAGEAENGEKALVMAKRLNPDIIITDIRMPVMDGIELIKQAKSENLEARFLVLSSYDDFGYVKEAMRYGADEYILKLQLEADQLLNALKTLTYQLEKEREEKEKRKIIEKYYDVGIPLVKEKFLKDLIFSDEIQSHEIEQQKKFLNIELPERNLLCLVVHVEKSKVHQQYSDEKLYLLNESIVKILDGVVSKHGCGYTVNTEALEFTIIYSLKEIYDERPVHEHINQLAANIRQSMNSYLNTAVYIGAGNIQQRYASLKHSYLQAVKAANKAFSCPEKSMVRYSEIEQIDEGSDNQMLLDELVELEHSLNAGDADKAGQIIGGIRQSIAKSGGMNKEYIKRICSVLLFVVNAYIHRQNLHHSGIWSDDRMLAELDHFSSVGEYVDFLDRLQKDISAILKDVRDEKSIILKARRFIQEHFSEDISLKDVADYLGLSPGYLSILYKKETGQNFIDYLIGLRMDYAKELLRTTDLKIYEVAKKVGYDNIYYFSRIFSKVVGIPPKQYQSNPAKFRH